MADEMREYSPVEDEIYDLDTDDDLGVADFFASASARRKWIPRDDEYLESIEAIRRLFPEIALDPGGDEPEDWWGDWGKDATERFNALLPSNDDDTPSYGLDRLILGFDIVFLPEIELEGGEVDPVLLPEGDRRIQFHPPKSEVWHDREHAPCPVGDKTFSCERWSSGQGDLGEDPENGLRRFKLDALHWRFWECRFLWLYPDYGDKSAPLKARLVKSFLFMHSCYTAVRNTRGNPELKGEITIDDQTWEITKNLEVFLYHIRLPTRCRVLWIRELCIDRCNEDEKQGQYHWQYQKQVENVSCGIILMNEVMEALQWRGYLVPQLQPRSKMWDRFIKSHEFQYPRHYPQHLGSSSSGDDQHMPYRYLALDLVADEIRLLSLSNAGDYHAPLVGDIAHVPLHGGHTYVGLSYTWGVEPADREILLNGQIMLITKNLDEALRALRPKSESRLRISFWIDAISINQDDPGEKSRQIPRMHDVFSNAAAVFAWPGPNTRAIQSGMNFARELTQPKVTVFDVDENGNSTGLKRTKRLARSWLHLYEVLRQPFFRRQWIVQELAAANLPNIVPTGGSIRGKIFHWQKLYVAADTFESNLKQICELWRSYDGAPLDRYDTFREAEECHGLWNPESPLYKSFPPLDKYKELAYADWEMEGGMAEQGLNDVWTNVRSVKILSYIRQLHATGREPSFLLLLILTQTFECTDARDKIYALWNLANDSSGLLIRPDYSKSVAEVYMDFTKAYATRNRNLDIICTTQFSFNAASTPLVPGPGPDKDLNASWCPDWRQHPHLNPFVRKSMFTFWFDRVEEIPTFDYAPYHVNLIEDGLTATHGGLRTSDPGSSEEIKEMDCPFKFDGSDLVAAGVIADTVEHVEAAPDDWYPVRTFPSQWRELVLEKHRQPDGSKPSLEQMGQAFYSMLIGHRSGTVSASMTDPERYKLNILELLLPPDQELDWEHVMRQTVKGRRLIITEKGYMGLAPWYVRPGFKLAILLGCSVPVVLEDHQPEIVHEEEPPGLYFRGDCFVQGWMFGEMMREFGITTEEAWAEIKGREQIRIH